MKHEWMLDVLTDLKTFAKANGLPLLAEQLADTADLAAVEITSTEKRARSVNGNEHTFGGYSPEVGDSRRA